ncbi:alpha/beta hydrolase [Microtetraspora sp. NBRC 16547]|uniref:alpha/beta fold hydrolase n=1 Tax=Microtetraspora sp. NBRC 16547 TaxID=3030993 RepID=UPI0024A130B1|nr:alpha/beta hydrolase [Microtetraspora sp. NBRC 16547]GLW98282.1 alpha/beta hydrolase [Microtetraspora sp. NBRC 16547]
MDLHPDAVSDVIAGPNGGVRYHDTGRPGDFRSTVLLIHGTGGTTKSHFGTLFPMLAARHRVIGVDLAVPDGGVEVGDLVNDVVAVLEARAAGEPVALVGYSLGAVVAAAVAADHAPLLSSLTLVAGWMRTDSQQRLRNTVWRKLFERDQEALREYMTFTSYGSPFLASRTDAEVRALVDARELAASLPATMDLNRRIDISAEVGRIVTPTLVVGAVDDQMAPIRHSRLLFGAIDDARFAEVATGHAVTVENPAYLFKLVDDFVSAPSAVPPGTVLEPITV